MVMMLLSGLLAFAVTAAMAPRVIPFLKKMKFGQQILDIGPNWHKTKQGTPTMGGLMFISGIIIAAAVFCRDIKTFLVLLVALFFGLIGFFDDYTKVVKKRNLGLRAREKLFLQALVSITCLVSFKMHGLTDTAVFVPFINQWFELGWGFYPFAVFVIVGTVNSVNLTDGIDGLATCVTIPICIFFAVTSFVTLQDELGILSSAAVGALIGFLIYNFYPAKIFMGDTGSLFLGGLVSALAFAYGLPVILLIVGFVYVMETLSDIIQVTFFKLTKKRVFKMAPLHHHFEKCGYSEVKIVMIFSSITVALCILAYVAVSQYYLV